MTAKSKPVFTKKSDSREVPFYIGDKVIQKELICLKVMNGDQGTIWRNRQYLMVEIYGKEISYDGRQFDGFAYATITTAAKVLSIQV